MFKRVSEGMKERRLVFCSTGDRIGLGNLSRPLRNHFTTKKALTFPSLRPDHIKKRLMHLLHRPISFYGPLEILRVVSGVLIRFRGEGLQRGAGGHLRGLV
mgnify:CR=1 FL=1